MGQLARATIQPSMNGESSPVPAAESQGALPSARHLRYLSLLRSNPDFRRLWLAQLVSEMGDWFYMPAIYDLLLARTHRGAAVGWAIIIQTLPWFFMTPFAGYVADRFARRKSMIAADVVRGLMVLGMLLSVVAADVRLIYLLLGVEVIFSSLFEPARSALLTNIISGHEILPANALSSSTWAFALAVGAALGGTVTALMGPEGRYRLTATITPVAQSSGAMAKRSSPASRLISRATLSTWALGHLARNDMSSTT